MMHLHLFNLVSLSGAICLQMASCFLYRDFHLLDPRDYVSVDKFLGGDKANNDWTGINKDSSTRKNFQSPARYSGAAAHRSSAKKSQDANLNQSPVGYGSPEPSKTGLGFDPPVFDDHEDHNQGYNEYSEPGIPDDTDDENDDNPWKPLNPHEPGNLKVKPFRKGMWDSTCVFLYWFKIDLHLMLHFILVLS